MNKYEGGIIISAGIGLISLLGWAVESWQNRKLRRSVGDGLRDLKDAAAKDISETLLHTAVSKAADSAVNKYVAADNCVILTCAKDNLEKEVTHMVCNQYDVAKKEVSEKIAARVAELDDPEALRKAVRARAEDILVRQFRDDLRDLKDKAEDSIDKAVTTYEDKLDEMAEKFEEKLDDKLDRASESLQSVKRVYDILGNGLGAKRESGIRIVTD